MKITILRLPYVYLATFIFNTGLDICLGKPLDDALLRTIRNEVQRLSDSLDDFREEADNQVRATIELFKVEFNKDLALIQEKQSGLNKGVKNSSTVKTS